MTCNKKVFLILAILVGLIPCMMTAAAAAESVKKIGIAPFDVHSSAEGGVLQTSLYHQLDAELRKTKKVDVIPAGGLFQPGEIISKEKVLDAGKKLGADYMIAGSIVQFGDTINVDARIYDVSARAMLSSISVQGKRETGLTPLVTVLTGEILSTAGLADKILRVEVAGNRKIGAAAITQNLRSKPGRPLSEEDVTADIKTIFKMGYFLDVSASVSQDPKGKVLTFTVVEKGLISEIRINGNKALDRDDILGAMSVKTRQNLNREKIKEDIQKIKALYDAKGYYNAEITDRIESDTQKDFVVILDIKENERLYIRSITFEGNEAFTQKELVNMMTTTERTFLGFITDTGILNREHLKQDVQKLSAFYFNNGFVNSQIGEPVITYDAKGIHIKITVREGKRFKIGSVNISGDELAKSRADLFAALRTQPGKHYDREAIMRDMEMITVAANDEGYAHADVNPQIKIHEKEQLVDLDFQLTKGPLVYIARIGISGNTVTRDKVIRRQLGLAEGDLYSSSKLKESYTALNQLRYFEEVDIQTEKAPDNKMDINIRVKEKNTGMFMIGAGYSAVDQAVIMAQIVQQNFLGYGQILSLKASLGSKTNNYELSFTEPWLFDLPLWCKADIWKYKKEYDSYTLDTKGGGLTLGYPIWDKITGYIGYKLSIDNIQDVNQDTATQYIKSQEGERITSAVTLSFGYDSTNDSMFPSKGIKAGAFVQHAGPPLGGTSKFTKYGGNIAGYYPLFRDIVIGAKARIGYLQNNDESDDKIPIFERYVLGGINSIRGLRYVGPVNNSTSDVIGGTSMMVFNLELVFPLVRNAGMKGVLFYDAGNTWNGGYYLNDLRQTCGAGVRWYSPIGPLRLEYGYILDRRGLNDEAVGRWEFTIGMFM